jgi:hypothetical protein
MSILELVDGERGRLRRLHVLGGLALAVGATCLLLALGASALGGARWMALPRALPFVVWVAVLVADVAVIVRTVGLLERRTTRGSVAEAIERDQQLRAGALRGALEVADAGVLGRRAADLMGRRLSATTGPLAPRERHSIRRHVVQWTAAAVAAVVALTVAAPVYHDGLLAIMRPVSAWRGTLLPPVHFIDLPPAVLRGESVHIRVDAPQRSTVTLSQRMPGDAWATQVVGVDARRGVADVEVGPLRGDLTLVATDGRSVSDTAVVRVTDRPFVGAVSLRATYPAYLGRGSEELPIGEPARVPQGTALEVSGRASTALRAVRLAIPGDTIALEVNDHAFNGHFEAKTSGHWTWLASGAAGPIADVPQPLELEVVPDSAPHAELISPAVDTIVAGDDRVTLHASASDDHALTRVDLVSWRQTAVGADEQPVVQSLSSGGLAVWDGAVTLDLSPRGLQPGDALHVKVVATDNSPWGQKGESRELLLKIPTLEERRALARAIADSTVSRAESAAQAEKSLEQRTSEAARDRSQRPQSADAPSNANGAGTQQNAMSYAAAEKAKAVAKDQRALTDKVKDLQRSAAAIEQQLKQAGALDSSLARQLQEAQALLRDALTPELMAQMQKLDSAAQQLSAEQSQQALRDLQAMQEKLREQLEKSAEMLKRAALEGSMQTLKDEAHEISDRDRALADSAGGKAPSGAQQAQAKQLADRSQKLDDDLKKLQGQLRDDKASAGANATEQARDHAAASEQELRRAAGERPSPADSAAAGNQAKAAADSQTTAPSGQRSGTPAKPAVPSPTGKSQTGQPQAGQSQAGKTQAGQSQAGQSQAGQSQTSQSQTGQSQTAQSRTGQSQTGQPSDQTSQTSNLQQSANAGADQMERASQAMSDARQSQVNAWKSELNTALDQAIQETLQMARQEQGLEQKARSGDAKADQLRGDQSAVKQGLDNTAQKLQQEGEKTSLLSGRSERAMSEAQQKVADAVQASADSRTSPQTASALGDAADALNRAAASLARDREKANTVSSATGFAEMIQQMQEMAKKQGSINSQAASLIPGLGQQMSGQMQSTARALAREQQQVAQQLDDLSESAGGDRAAQLAKEAKQLADALSGGRIDATTLARQQQLFRRLLDAGRSLEKDERDDTGKRQATAATSGNEFKPDNTNATGRAAMKFREPTWDELRGLTADERRTILEYFKRINAQNP